MNRNFATMTDAEREQLHTLPPVNYTDALEGKASIFEYDDTLNHTIERTPDGREFIVRLEDGKMRRLRELVTPNSRRSVAA